MAISLMIMSSHHVVILTVAAATAVAAKDNAMPPLPPWPSTSKYYWGAKSGSVDCLEDIQNSALTSRTGEKIFGVTSNNRNRFLSSLLQVRGGEAPPPNSINLDADIDDDVSAEELLNSIFAIDEPSPSQRPPNKQAKTLPDTARKSNPRPSAKSLKNKAAKINNVNGANDEDDKLEKSVREKANVQNPRFNKDGDEIIDLDEMDAKPIREGITNGKLKSVPDTNIEKRGGVGIKNGSQRNTLNRVTKDSYKTSVGNPGESKGKQRKEGGQESMGQQQQTKNSNPKPVHTSTLLDDKTAHAVWGPNVEYRKKAPGPPPSKATEDERRVHEQHQRVHNERKTLMSKLALSLHDSHISAVQSLIKGSAAHIPPALFGQTIMQEKSACNEKFHDVLEDAKSRREMNWKAELESSVLGEEMMGSLEPSFRHIEDPSLLSYWGLTPNAKLYGGAQYHRVIRYYHHLFLTVPFPPITDDEVALLTNGITEVHDASDLMRAVALLVQHKMEIVMEDVLADMTRRLLYVMDRQWEMVDYSMALHRPMGGSNGLGKSGDKALREADLFQRHGTKYTTAEADLKNILSLGFHKFAEERAAEAHDKSLEDVRSLLRYITWDMGRARKRGKNQDQNQGFMSQIEIVKDEPTVNDHAQQNGEANGSNRKESSVSKTTKKKNKKSSMSGHSNRMSARGGAAVGSGRKRSKRGDELNKSHRRRKTKGGGISASYEEEEEELDEGDLIGGVMNRGKLDAEDDIRGEANSSTSLVVSSKSSPIFSGDDEVLNVLLGTVSSTLVPKSDTQAGHTQAAIESLVSYVCDRMRMDLSRIIRSKFNTFFLLAFYEELAPYLRRELDTYLAHHLDE